MSKTPSTTTAIALSNAAARELGKKFDKLFLAVDGVRTAVQDIIAAGTDAGLTLSKPRYGIESALADLAKINEGVFAPKLASLIALKSGDKIEQKRYKQIVNAWSYWAKPEDSDDEKDPKGMSLKSIANKFTKVETVYAEDKEDLQKMKEHLEKLLSQVESAPSKKPAKAEASK